MNANLQKTIKQLKTLGISQQKFTCALSEALGSDSPLVPSLPLLFILAKLSFLMKPRSEAWREILHAMQLRAPLWTSERSLEENLPQFMKLWQKRCGISSKLNLQENIVHQKHWDQILVGDEELSLRCVCFLDKDLVKARNQQQGMGTPLTDTPQQQQQSPFTSNNGGGGSDRAGSAATPFSAAPNDDTKDPLFITPTPLSFSKYTEKAVKRVNEYLTRVSTGKWQNFIQQIDKETNALLFVLCTFRGQWAYMFPNSDTEEEHPFFLIDENNFGKDLSPSKKTPIMVRRNTAEMYGLHKWTKDLQFRSLTLPFSQSRFSMLCLIPEKNTSQQFELLEQTILDEEQNVNMIQRICSEQQQQILQEVKVPKMKMNFERDLTDVLKGMEVSRLFSPDGEAQLDESLGPNAFVSRIILKCQIELDEDGVLPAPNTLDNPSKSKKKGKKGKKGKKATGPPEDTFVADRPFIGIIYNGTMQVPVFVTKFMDPEKMDGDGKGDDDDEEEE